MAVSSRLRMIARTGTGCDSIDLVEAKRRGVTVTNIPGGNAKVCGYSARLIKR